MPMVGSNMATNIENIMKAASLVGDSTAKIANVVGNGSVSGIVGLPFSTTDVGPTAGAGSGTGTGIIISPSFLTSAIYAKLQVLGPGTSNALIANAVGTAMSMEAAKASLSSTHGPVFAGTGTVIPGSIPVVGPVLGLSIFSQGLSKGFLGASWPIISNAFGMGLSEGWLIGLGSVIITGGGAPGSPGAGVGIGIIS